MKDIYLFGAGMNLPFVLSFFENSDIVGIIDNDKEKWGKTEKGIPIISLEEYKKNGCDKDILITLHYRAKEIEEQLSSQNINNYYRIPWLGNHRYITASSLCENLGLMEYPCVIFTDKNPMSEKMMEELRAHNIENCYEDEYGEQDGQSDIIIVQTEDREVKKEYLRTKYKEAKIVYYLDDHDNTTRYEKLEKYKNIHKGKRCFLIGNGPSLTYSDLSVLRENNEICFGVNRVYLGFENTEWRPNYYVVGDAYLIRDDMNRMKSINCDKFLRDSIENDENIENYFTLYKNIPNYIESPRFSFDIKNGVYGGGSILYDVLQIAVYMGFKEIYILGMDLTQGMRAQDEGYHFYKSPNVNEPLGYGDNDAIRFFMKHACEELKSKDILLRNATKNVWWDDVPRVDFEGLLRD